MKADPFLLGLHLDGRKTLVVGGGDEAARRAGALAGAGSAVTVVAESPGDLLRLLAARGEVRLAHRPFHEDDLDGAWLAVLADADPAAAERIGTLAAARRVFFCAVDQPAWSTFSHVALARSGGVTIAVSTAGRAPALARRLREELERVLASAPLAEFVERLRRLRARTPSADRRKVLGAAVAGVRICGDLELPDSPGDPDEEGDPSSG